MVDTHYSNQDYVEARINNILFTIIACSCITTQHILELELQVNCINTMCLLTWALCLRSKQ